VGEARIELGAGAALVAEVPAGLREEPAEALPAFDVSTVPGARVAGRRGFTDGALSVRLACAVAPARGYAPGVEEIVLARASVLAKGAVPGLERWDERPAAWVGPACEQRLEGRAGGAHASARHVFGFVGDAPEAVACSVVCAEPEGGARCEAVVAGARVTGLVAPPPPSLVVRAALFAAEHPRGAGVAVLALGAAVVVAVLAGRPRPRP
jgi:hypothetical protein